uniref:Myb/SANT-like DNA-binding domain-containing protein n=1 Tax=Gasterosteus aculeatus aculeatus TaxID=481459 RepID=A0AAQ4PI44_GASAC
ISNRLMQQGVERDWKQCHTKYKNLKYLYRSLQRGRSDEADPRRLMRFYDEVDAIMNRPADGSPCRGGEESERDTQTNGAREMERATHDPTDTDSASSVSLGVAPVPELLITSQGVLFFRKTNKTLLIVLIRNATDKKCYFILTGLVSSPSLNTRLNIISTLNLNP